MKRPYLYVVYCFLCLFLAGSPVNTYSQSGPFENSTVFQQAEEDLGDPGSPGDPVNPGCDPLDNTNKPGEVCPIDNGLLILLAGGAIFGIIQIKRSRTSVL